jgi:hypothetical protein
LELVTRLKCLSSRVCLIAEITKYNANIHYHGLIQFLVKSVDHIIDFHNLFRNSKLFGFKNIKQIEDEDGWITYISKDLEHTKKVLCRPPIVIDDFDSIPLYWTSANSDFIFHDLINEQ